MFLTSFRDSMKSYRDLVLHKEKIPAQQMQTFRRQLINIRGFIEEDAGVPIDPSTTDDKITDYNCIIQANGLAISDHSKGSECGMKYNFIFVIASSAGMLPYCFFIQSFLFT